MVCALSGSVEAINSSLSAVCLFEFFANLYYSAMACWPCAGSVEWRLLWYFLLRHRSCFPFLKKTKGIAQLDHRASKNEGFVYLKVYRETFTISYLISMIHEMAKQWGGVQAFHCMTNGCKCFSLILLLSELRILQLITPLTFFSFKRSL